MCHLATTQKLTFINDTLAGTSSGVMKPGQRRKEDSSTPDFSSFESSSTGTSRELMPTQTSLKGSKICSKPTCSKVGKPQPLSEFYRHTGCSDGYRPDCKTCHNQYRADWARERYVPVTGHRLDMSPDAKAERARLRDERDDRRAARLRRRSPDAHLERAEFRARRDERRAARMRRQAESLNSSTAGEELKSPPPASQCEMFQ